jgi:topoisomerase IA-like protein
LGAVTSKQNLQGAAGTAVDVAQAAVRQVVNALMERSGGQVALAGDRLREMVRTEVQRALKELTGISPAEVADLHHRVSLLEGRLAVDEVEMAAGRAAAKKAAAKKVPAKKVPAKKATAKKAPAKKSPPPPPHGDEVIATPATVAERASVVTPAPEVTEEP